MNYKHAYHVFEQSVANEKLDILFSLGGDGTVLDTLRLVRDSGTPVLGINLGRFGFLAHSQQEDFAATFELIKNKSYTIDPRSVIELESDIDLFDGFPFGLNDFIVHKKDTSNMITVHTYLDGALLNSYWADGLIVATPTGSTGYSLSCGGPILFPGSSSLVITPIAPHNLSLRSLVIGDTKNISFDIEGRTEDFLVTIDSRSVSVTKGTKLSVKKADFQFNMIKLEGHNHITTLRNKLMWGIDKRN
jgi:NAD+ kinase